MNGDGPGRTRQVSDLCRIDMSGIFFAEAPHPLPGGIVLIEEFAVMAARNSGQWPLIVTHVVKIYAYGQRTVVGVRPVGDVLVPFYFFSAPGSLEIQF